MPETVVFSELVKGFDILVGGIDSVIVESLTDKEKALLDAFIDNRIEMLTETAPPIAKIFEESRELIHIFGEIAKGMFKKGFGGEVPTTGQFGVGDLIPQDIRYTATPSPTTAPAYSHYELNDWYISLTAGEVRYLLGDGTNFFKPSPTTENRAIILILKNGLIEIGSTPEINQGIFRTEKANYASYRIHVLREIPIVEGKLLYQYNLPVAIPCFYNFGVMWGVMPIRTNPAAYLPLIGVTFFEHNYASTPRYTR